MLKEGVVEEASALKLPNLSFMVTFCFGLSETRVTTTGCCCCCFVVLITFPLPNIDWLNLPAVVLAPSLPWNRDVCSPLIPLSVTVTLGPLFTPPATFTGDFCPFDNTGALFCVDTILGLPPSLPLTPLVVSGLCLLMLEVVVISGLCKPVNPSLKILGIFTVNVFSWVGLLGLPSFKTPLYSRMDVTDVSESDLIRCAWTPPSRLKTSCDSRVKWLWSIYTWWVEVITNDTL